MEQTLASAQEDTAALLAALPGLPPDVDGWIGVYGGRHATVHIDPRAGDDGFDRAVLALTSTLGDGAELGPGDAGFSSALRTFVLERRVAGWGLSVVTRLL